MLSLFISMRMCIGALIIVQRKIHCEYVDQQIAYIQISQVAFFFFIFSIGVSSAQRDTVSFLVYEHVNSASASASASASHIRYSHKIPLCACEL